MDNRTRPIIPFLVPFYRNFAGPVALLALRLATGTMLVIEGWPKILSPFAMSGFVASLGFHPGALWSLALALLEFGGGIMLVIGLLTRPVALACAFMLAVTWWFHFTHPYGTAILTPEGIQAIAGAAAPYLTPEATGPLIALNQDGGANFLHLVQLKAEGFSLLWTLSALVFAALGGGALSADRILGREF